MMGITTKKAAPEKANSEESRKIMMNIKLNAADGRACSCKYLDCMVGLGGYGWGLKEGGVGEEGCQTK